LDGGKPIYREKEEGGRAIIYSIYSNLKKIPCSLSLIEFSFTLHYLACFWEVKRKPTAEDIVREGVISFSQKNIFLKKGKFFSCDSLTFFTCF